MLNASQLWVSCLGDSKGLLPVGANLAVDVPWKYLNFFLDDDEQLEKIGIEYSAGRMMTGEVKKVLIEVSTATSFTSLAHRVHGRQCQPDCVVFPCRGCRSW